ncbi:type II toxin-antitoxin system RelE/ParE family toxin [Bradyrhizobium sp. USDA 329]|uniref:type II toxin-antitoxin system RelE/ParE family toxin n=1 Tax=unclassified Bradyrhizobium TaxID=2631580 RepID=UPI0035172243
MLAVWTFRCYVSASGRDMFKDWYDDQSEQVQAAVDVALEFLAQRPRHDWRRPEFDLLSGKMREVGEIRFKVDKQYRILGFFGPNTSEFTMLIGASKKGSNYDPRNALETALDRMDQVKKDKGRSHVFDF